MLDALRSTIEDSVARGCREGFQRESLLRALRRPGFALHSEAACRAGLLTLEIHRLAGGAIDCGLLAAAAVELQMEAAFIFDHVGDEEMDDGRSVAEELALAPSLLYCGLLAASLAVSKARVSEDRRCDLLRQAYIDCNDACAGQLLDALFTKRALVTTEESLRMTTLKAGSLGRFAASFGAGLATEDGKLVDLFAEFGSNLFTYLQLADDMRDTWAGGVGEADLERNKKTVPLTFFWNSLSAIDSGGIILESAGSKRRVYLSHRSEARGAGLFAAVVAETYLNRAKDGLAAIRRILGEDGRLQQFVEDAETTSLDALACLETAHSLS